MKKTHIIGIVFIAILLAVLATSFAGSGAYANFEKAFASPQESFHVVGQLDESKPVVYEPRVNANLTKFYMLDEDSISREVILAKAKPSNFDQAEQLVLIGQAGEDGKFHASEILTKCPSKYEDKTTVSEEAAKASK